MASEEKQPVTMKIDNEATNPTTTTSITMPNEHTSTNNSANDKQTLVQSESSEAIEVVKPISDRNVKKQQQPKEPETKEMTQFKKDTVRRIKHLFLLFVRQFDVHEFEIMVRFLRVLLEKHKHEPLKMFGKLINFKISNQLKIENESLSRF